MVADFENEGASERVGSGFSAGSEATEAAEPQSSGGPVNLNEASFEELREAGLSVTQTGRVLAHRERGTGFASVDELDDLPGFPREFLDEIKPKLTV